MGTTEEQLVDLMNAIEAARIRLEKLEADTSVDDSLTAALFHHYHALVNQFISLADAPLRTDFANLRPRLEQSGARYTEMIGTFFLKLYERRLQLHRPLDSFQQLKRLIAKVLFRQLLDYLKLEKRRRTIEREVLAPMVLQREQYWNQRYTIPFQDMILEVEEWSTDLNQTQRMMAETIQMRYFAGCEWQEIQKILGITQYRMREIQDAIRERFQVKE